MDDQELQDHLRDLISEDGQVDMHDLQIIARNGMWLSRRRFQASRSTAILLNILTAVAGARNS